MSNVQLAIGGRAFTVACADGEERHVTQLAKMVDAVASSGNLRTQSETRMLLFAALMLADELHEAREALATRPPVDARVEQRVERIADRLEALAEQLEHAAS